MSAANLQEYGTLPGLLRRNAGQWPSAVAIREKSQGIWKTHTWADCLAQVRRIALGLRSLGLQGGEVVALIGRNRPEWVFTQLAAHASSAPTLGIHKESLPWEIEHLLNRSEARVVLAEDQEQVDKLLELGNKLASVRHIVYINPRGMKRYGDPRLVSIQKLIASGEEIERRRPGDYDVMVGRGSPEDISILCATSGTTDKPKLVMFTNRAFLMHCAAALSVDLITADDEYVSLLPLASVTEQIFAVGHFLISGMKVNFVEGDQTADQDFREIGPTLALLAPQRWQALAAEVKAQMADASAFKRGVYNWAQRMAVTGRRRGRPSWLGNLLIGTALRDRLGMSNVRSAAAAGAPLAAEVFEFFHALGIPLRQLYGQAEMGGVYVAHRSRECNYDTVGAPFHGVDVRIHQPNGNGIGEIIARHPGMFAGYFRDGTATEQVLRDGWMYTGDAGHFNEHGHLIVIDRMSDMTPRPDGGVFSPQYLENRLKTSPYIGECVAVGYGQGRISSIICIRYSVVSRWAEKRQINFNSYGDLVARPEVQELIKSEVEQINGQLLPDQRVRRFVLLYKQFDADDGELTRTGNLRRGVIHSNYASLIRALDGDAGNVEIDEQTELPDGRRIRMHASLAIVSTVAQGEIQ